MKTYQYTDLNPSKIQKLCERQGIDFKSIISLLEEVQQNIQSNGDRALQEYTQKFDGVSLDSFLVTEAEFKEAEKIVSEKFKKSASRCC